MLVKLAALIGSIAFNLARIFNLICGAVDNDGECGTIFTLHHREACERRGHDHRQCARESNLA